MCYHLKKNNGVCFLREESDHMHLELEGPQGVEEDKVNWLDQHHANTKLASDAYVSSK